MPPESGRRPEAPLEVGGVRLPRPQRRRGPLGPVGRVGEQLRLERDAVAAGLRVVHRSGIFFKALANFQWDRLLQTDIVSKQYLEGCYQLGQQYPDLCSSIFLMCERGPSA